MYTVDDLFCCLILKNVYKSVKIIYMCIAKVDDDFVLRVANFLSQTNSPLPKNL